MVQLHSSAIIRILFKGIKPKSQSQTIIREVMQPFQGNRMYIRLAGVAGATATIMASVGAHRQFPNENDETLKKNYETANRFHFFGALGLIAVPFTRFPHLVRNAQGIDCRLRLYSNIMFVSRPGY